MISLYRFSTNLSDKSQFCLLKVNLIDMNGHIIITYSLPRVIEELNHLSQRWRSRIPNEYWKLIVNGEEDLVAKNMDNPIGLRVRMRRQKMMSTQIHLRANRIAFILLNSPLHSRKMNQISKKDWYNQEIFFLRPEGKFRVKTHYLSETGWRSLTEEIWLFGSLLFIVWCNCQQLIDCYINSTIIWS